MLPLPNTPSWRGVQLKKSTGTSLPLLYTTKRTWRNDMVSNI